MFSVPTKPGEYRGERLGEFESRSVKARDTVQGFYLLEISPGYEGTDNMFYLFYKFISYVNKEKDFIRSAYVYLNFFHETLNSHNLEIGFIKQAL